MPGCPWTHALLLLAALPLATGQPWPRCDSTSGNYSAGSAYEANLLNLILDLRQNASLSRSRFASGAGGASPDDTVYGLVLCRGDVTNSECFDCGTAAWERAGTACGRPIKDVMLCYNACYVRISDTDFLASTNNSGEIPLHSGVGIGSSDVAGYDRAVTGILNATVQYAAENSTELFATGEWVGSDPGFSHIFTAAQCAGDLSRAQCRSCLQDLLGGWWTTFRFNRAETGSRVAASRCTLRAEAGDAQTRFFNGDAMVMLPTKVAAPGPAAPAGTTGGSRLLRIVLPILGIAVIAAVSLCVWSTIRKKRRSRIPAISTQSYSVDDLESVKSILLSLSSLQVATDNFDENNKLGEGGFGAVYKGVLSGEKVAVKRLSKGSTQGLEEVKNELVLAAKLHHKNLVRLVGFSLEAGERLLVYEYMPNNSLDTILFDPEEKCILDWATRYRIIEGVARGLQYLHEDSQEKIVHRDLKASNVLLDADMMPKIGDFGLARLFGEDQTRMVTSRIVGTFGYMSPEYVTRGLYSVKSDVYSFGVLVIEIVAGRMRNNRSYLYEENEDMINIVWRHWTKGTIAEMVDHSLGINYPSAEVLKCVHIGLLCLQENPVDRPTMLEIMVMLNSDTTAGSLPAATRPAFLLDGSSGFPNHTKPPLFTDSLTSGR
ncbi:unnamed protein product [Alopecurus aequalis]